MSGGGYILTFKTEPDLCGISCPCATDYGTDEERREIKADVEFERTHLDAASRYQESADVD